MTQDSANSGKVAEDLAAWARENLTDAKYAEDKGRLTPLHYDETCGIAWAREKLIAHLKEIHDGTEEKAEVHDG
jgi:hypothetical protein